MTRSSRATWEDLDMNREGGREQDIVYTENEKAIEARD